MVEPETARAGLEALAAAIAELAEGMQDVAVRPLPGAAQPRRASVLTATHVVPPRKAVDLPPMGLRLRLRADYDLSGVTGQARVIAEAMKTYGLIVADNGSNWFFQGGSDPRWDDDDLGQLKAIPGTAFEVVDTGPVVIS